MNEDKKYLVEEVLAHLNKSDYVFLTDFQKVTVAETAELRRALAVEKAEYHVVKNNILRVALKSIDRPGMDDHLQGHTAIIVGGESPSEVVKILVKFNKDKEKGVVKVGVMGGNMMSASDIVELSKLPSLPVLRSQLLSLFNEPARQCARVIQSYIEKTEQAA